MSAYLRSSWNARSKAVAAVMPFDAGFEGEPMREKMAAARDTLIVLGLQIVFRVAMMLRRWNY